MIKEFNIENPAKCFSKQQDTNIFFENGKNTVNDPKNCEIFQI